MKILLLLIIGAAAGYIATRVADLETSVPVTIAIGVAGALIGIVLFKMLLVLLGLAAGVIGAVVGALLLIWLYQAYMKQRG